MDSAIPRPLKWNKTEWALARKRAIASKDPICAICHKEIDLEAPPFHPSGGRSRPYRPSIPRRRYLRFR
jgi:hypothetical protein